MKSFILLGAVAVAVATVIWVCKQRKVVVPPEAEAGTWVPEPQQ